MNGKARVVVLIFLQDANTRKRSIQLEKWREGCQKLYIAKAGWTEGTLGILRTKELTRKAGNE